MSSELTEGPFVAPKKHEKPDMSNRRNVRELKNELRQQRAINSNLYKIQSQINK